MNYYKYFIGLFLFCVACGEDASAPPMTVNKFYGNPRTIMITQIIAPEIINIAQTLNVEYQINYPENYHLEFPELPNELAKFGDFTLVNKNLTPARLTAENNLQRILTLNLSPFLAGDYIIPALTFKFTDAQKKSSNLSVDEVTLTVTPIIPADEPEPQLRELAEIKDLPTSWTTYAILLLAILAILAGGVYWQRQRQRHHVTAMLPPHLLAQQALEKLLASTYLAKGEYDLFYALLSAILRRYIEQRFNHNAPDQTTEEFLDTLRTATDFSPEQRRLLQNFLQHCDLVKFAKLLPTSIEINAAVTAVREFINETTSEMRENY